MSIRGKYIIEIIRRGGLNKPRRLFRPFKTVDVPVGVMPGLYEQMRVLIRGDEKARVSSKSGEVLFSA